MWDNLKNVLGGVAPTLASALGGPLVGGAVTALTQTLGLKPQAKAKEILAAVASADPETVEKLKALEVDYEKRIAELNVDLERINADDRSNARDREIKTQDKTPKIIALITVGAFFIYILVVSFLPAEFTNNEFIFLALGWIGGVATSVYTYYFGSSSESERKDLLMDRR